MRLCAFAFFVASPRISREDNERGKIVWKGVLTTKIAASALTIAVKFRRAVTCKRRTWCRALDWRSSEKWCSAPGSVTAFATHNTVGNSATLAHNTAAWPMCAAARAARVATSFKKTLRYRKRRYVTFTGRTSLFLENTFLQRAASTREAGANVNRCGIGTVVSRDSLIPPWISDLPDPAYTILSRAIRPNRLCFLFSFILIIFAFINYHSLSRVYRVQRNRSQIGYIFTKLRNLEIIFGRFLIVGRISKMNSYFLLRTKSTASPWDIKKFQFFSFALIHKERHDVSKSAMQESNFSVDISYFCHWTNVRSERKSSQGPRSLELISKRGSPDTPCPVASERASERTAAMHPG